MYYCVHYIIFIFRRCLKKKKNIDFCSVNLFIDRKTPVQFYLKVKQVRR